MDGAVRQVCEFLQRNTIRATYGAVSEYLHMGNAQGAGEWLGAPCQLASWVVNARTGQPTGYMPTQIHPDLELEPEIICTGDDLALKIRLEERRLNLEKED